MEDVVVHLLTPTFELDRTLPARLGSHTATRRDCALTPVSLGFVGGTGRRGRLCGSNLSRAKTS